MYNPEYIQKMPYSESYSGEPNDTSMRDKIAAEKAALQVRLAQIRAENAKKNGTGGKRRSKRAHSKRRAHRKAHRKSHRKSHRRH